LYPAHLVHQIGSRQSQTGFDRRHAKDKRLTRSATGAPHKTTKGGIRNPAHLVNVDAEYLAEGGEEFAPLSMRSKQAGMTMAIVQDDVVYDVQIVGIGILQDSVG
jgi:hypothetical protein